MGERISQEFLDIEHFREQLRGWDTPAIQITPGRLRIRLQSVNLGDLFFSDIRLNRRVIDHSRVEAGWINFVVNLSPAAFCGIEVDVGHMTVLTPGREYRSVLSDNWRSIEIVISLSALEEEGLRLAPHLVSGPENASIALPSELVGIFRHLADAAFGRSEKAYVNDAWLRRALLRALDKALQADARQRDGHGSPRKVEGYDLTRKMIRYIESRFGRRVAVDEVACELGITPRALHYAARSALGLSPHEVILAVRLHHVRNELWDARRSSPSVTAAALAQDFGHLGRFSQQYRALFGELPSHTLARIRLLGENDADLLYKAGRRDCLASPPPSPA